MTGSELNEWEPPDPSSEPDTDEIIIPWIPWDDDTQPDLEDTDNDEEEEEEG